MAGPEGYLAPNCTHLFPRWTPLRTHPFQQFPSPPQQVATLLRDFALTPASLRVHCPHLLEALTAVGAKRSTWTEVVWVKSQLCIFYQVTEWPALSFFIWRWGYQHLHRAVCENWMMCESALCVRKQMQSIWGQLSPAFYQLWTQLSCQLLREALPDHTTERIMPPLLYHFSCFPLYGSLLPDILYFLQLVGYLCILCLLHQKSMGKNFYLLNSYDFRLQNHTWPI